MIIMNLVPIVVFVAHVSALDVEVGSLQRLHLQLATESRRRLFELVDLNLEELEILLLQTQRREYSIMNS